MTSVVIVAAGRGTRMGTGVDKLFLPVAGRPVVGHTWLRFDVAPFVDEIVLVIRAERRAQFEALAASCALQKPFRLVAGGAERQHSVWNGLEALNPMTELVAIHDGARPCTAVDLIGQTLEAARQMGAAVVAERVTDTVKESQDGRTILRTIDRSRLWTVQTPQAFRVEVIRRALATVRDRGMQVTDDAAACELIGQPVHLVEAKTPNPKVTVAEDLPYVELLLRTSVSASA